MAADGRAARLSDRVRRERIIFQRDPPSARSLPRRSDGCRTAWAIEWELLDAKQVRELVPLTDDTASAASICVWRPRQSAAHRAGLCLGAAGSRRAHPAALPGRCRSRRPAAGSPRSRRRAGVIALRRAGRRGGPADRAADGAARRRLAACVGARGDDRDRARAADADRRRRRQRPLRPPDAARQPRLWRRTARMDRRLQPTGPAARPSSPLVRNLARRVTETVSQGGACSA